MQPKNILISSLKDSFTSIWKNKSLFALLFVAQIAFFAIFSFVNYHYHAKMIESSKSIYEYINKLQFDESKISQNLLEQKSILGEDPLMISRNFNDIIRNFRLYAAWIFALLVIFCSASWALTGKFSKSMGIKHLSNVFFRNLAVLLFYLGLIFLFFFSLLNISITQLTTEASRLFSKYLLFLAVSLILSYFMFISLSLANKTELSSIVQKTLSVGIKKAHYVLTVYFINVVLFGISAFLLYYFIEKNQFILFTSITLMIFSFVFGKVLLINVVEKLD